MKFRKTFYTWLTNRYIVIVRNEENFAVKTTFSTNYAKIIVFTILIFAISSFLSFFLITTALSRWYNPKHAQMQAKRQVVKLASKVDSLAIAVRKKDKYINNIKAIINGEEPGMEDLRPKQKAKNISPADLEEISSVDSLIRSRFESRSALSSHFKKKKEALQRTNFFTPVDGVVISPFSIKNGNYGINILAPEDEPVKSVANGTILNVLRTEGKGVALTILHKDGLVSVYQNMKDSDKELGTSVTSGEVIGYTGNNSESGNLNFQLWYEGLPLDPENFVSF